MADIKLRDPDNDQVFLGDNVELIFGDGADANDASAGDISMRWDGTDFDILQTTANSAINLGVDGAGIDFKLFGDTASAYLLWDQSADDLILSGAAGLVMNGTAGISLGDDVKLKFGASSDITIDWNAAGGLDILQAAANSAISVGVDGAGIDLKLFGDTASAYCLWDQSADELILAGAAGITVPDGALTLGATAVSATAAEINRQCDASARIVAAGATLSATEALHDGKVVLFDQASGSVVTLPAATGSGTTIKFVVQTDLTSSSHIVKVADADDTFIGIFDILDLDGTAQAAYQASGTDDTLTMNDTTTGGHPGDWVEVIDVAANTWFVHGQSTCATGSNVADPFSATVA